MEFAGEEKKLQALFSELKQAEEQSAPRFARVWNRAALKPQSVRSFNPAFGVASALVVCAVLAIAVWSRYRPQSPALPVARVETPAAPTNQGPAATTTVSSPPAAPTSPSKETFTGRRSKRTTRRNATQLAANRKLRQEAKAITEWESPTSALLSSPSDSLFSSLPQLNENATGLQSYLPSRPN